MSATSILLIEVHLQQRSLGSNTAVLHWWDWGSPDDNPPTAAQYWALAMGPNGGGFFGSTGDPIPIGENPTVGSVRTL
jgi:hypothetical protein